MLVLDSLMGSLKIIPHSPQKETHNKSCGFCISRNVENLFSKENGNTKAYTAIAMLGFLCLYWISILGLLKIIPHSP